MRESWRSARKQKKWALYVSYICLVLITMTSSHAWIHKKWLFALKKLVFLYWTRFWKASPPCFEVTVFEWLPFSGEGIWVNFIIYLMLLNCTLSRILCKWLLWSPHCILNHFPVKIQWRSRRATIFWAHYVIVILQLLSHVWLFVTPWTAALQRPLDSTISQNLLKFMSIELVILSNHLFLCHLLPLLLSIFPRVFSNEVALHIKWPKYWNLELQQKSFQWIFQVDFLYDWLVWSPCSPRDSQESSSASQFESIVLWHSAFFMVQLSYLHDCWENHNFDYMDFCWQSDVSAF